MSEHFGTLPDGREVRRYRLRTPSGGELRLLDLGAAVQGYRLDAGDPGSEVIVGFDDLDDVLAVRKAYFGAVVGRYANRLAAARITVDGREYTLSANEGATCLHGGAEGFDSRVWRVVEESADAVAFELASPDGDQGFPGELTARARYGVLDGGFALELSAVTQAPTVALLTAHVYANLDLDGAGTIDDQVLTVDADAYVPVDADLIPTGELATVAGTIGSGPTCTS